MSSRWLADRNATLLCLLPLQDRRIKSVTKLPLTVNDI
jgi:hypothetical protein